jgi:O-succinylbenzoic acid--CoA ligase
MSRIRINGTTYSAEKNISIVPPELSDYLNLRLNDPVFINMKTSGSTGEPKEITISVDAMSVHAGFTCRYFDIRPNHNLLLALPINFVAGKMMVERAICSGANLITVLPHIDPLSGIKKPDDIYFAAFTPAQIYALLETREGEIFLQSIEKVLIGGGPVNSHLESKLIDSGIVAYFSYGMTESLSHVAVRKVGNRLYEAIDDSIQFLTDHRGCLVIRASYLGDQNLITNDSVALAESGCFEWLGRLDFVINSGGVKLYPEQIENKLSSVLDGSKLLIGSKSDDQFGERPVLVIEGMKEIPNLEHLIESTLEKFERPVQIIYTYQLPILESQKPNRKALREIIKKAGSDSPCFIQ